MMRLITFLLLIVNVSQANLACRGRFVNPITDICWECMLPITVAGVNMGSGNSPKARDIRGPRSPVCACTVNKVPLPGITFGFWEPVRLVDITRTPYCLTNLGGVQVAEDKSKISSYSGKYGRSAGNRHSGSDSFYHVHYYVYPLIYWLELLTDVVCLEQNSFDVAYMSEFDITWNDPNMQTLLNPEAILFGNPVAQGACALDCAAATCHFALDNMFWCAGCYGNLYPLNGANSDHSGGVQTSSLLVTRILTKMHRLGLGQSTSTTDASVDGPLCRKNISLKTKKSQYKLQMTNPKPSTGISCWPLGLTDTAYSSFKEYPFDGEDWGYLIWRKKSCCLF